MSNTTICVRTTTRGKLRKLAELERRSMLLELDGLLDHALRHRGYDPETLEPIANGPGRCGLAAPVHAAEQESV